MPLVFAVGILSICRFFVLVQCASTLVVRWEDFLGFVDLKAQKGLHWKAQLPIVSRTEQFLLNGLCSARQTETASALGF